MLLLSAVTIFFVALGVTFIHVISLVVIGVTVCCYYVLLLLYPVFL